MKVSDERSAVTYGTEETSYSLTYSFSHSLICLLWSYSNPRHWWQASRAISINTVNVTDKWNSAAEGPQTGVKISDSPNQF